MKAVNSLLVISILLFATVMSWTYFAVQSNQSSSLPQVGIGGGPETANYTSQFRTLLSEHGNLTITHLTNVYDGNDTSETSIRLEDNVQKLGNVVGQIGNPADRDEFMRIFRGHIEEYEIYTKGLKENKPAALNTAKENLQMHAMDFGNLVYKLMPTISEQRGTELMNDHINGTLLIIDAHAKGDTSKKLNALQSADAQAVMFADELGDAAEKASN